MDDGTMTGRIVQLIDAVTAAHSVSLGELARDTGLPRSSVHRIAEDLCRRGLLVKVEDRYQLGSRIVTWGCRALEESTLRMAAAPVLAELHDRSKQFTWVYRVDGDDVQIIDRSNPAPIPALISRLPWPRTLQRAGLVLAAGGRAAIADRPERVEELLRAGVPRSSPYSPAGADRIVEAITHCRENGWTVDREGFILGWACVAAPVKDANGNTVGVIGVTGRSGSFDPTRHIDPVRAGAEAASARLRSAA